MTQETHRTTPTQPGASQAVKTGIAPHPLIPLWEKALGRRFRELPRSKQELVIVAIGCDDGVMDPLAVAYNVPFVGGDWTEAEQAAMQPYGVEEPDYLLFIYWNDKAKPEDIAQCRAWLKAQQEVPNAATR